jgi:arylsulfatase A-like enzyme
MAVLRLPRRLVLAAACWLAVTLAGCADPAPRDLLLISVDTLRADALGAAGNAEAHTPNLDRLIAGGTYFTAAVTPIPRTTPALGSLLTGRWPQRHGSRDVGDPIGAVATLAEILRGHGFATVAVSANSSAGPKQGLDRGFERFVTYEDLEELYAGRLYSDLSGATPDKPGWAKAVTDQALERIGELPTGEPWFAWLFYFDPHFLYRPPAPWQDEVEAEKCWQLYAYYQQHRRLAGQVFADVGGVASAAREDCLRLYRAEVSYADHEIGRLLAALEERGRLDDTLIVFTADHGENFGEGGLFFEHGDNAHDAGLRVPLAFVGPGIAKRRRDGGAVSLVDVVPTVLALLGLDSEPPSTDGRDLSPRLAPGGEAGEEDLSRIVFAESATAIWNESVEHVTTGRTWWRVCINGPRFSLCEIPEDAPGEYLLYDHVADPNLTRDVAADHPEEVEVLRAAWKNWPPESARQRVARTAEFKLVETPRLTGGYGDALYHLATDPEETVDVRERYPQVYETLRAALDEWTSELPAPPPRAPDPELEASLRALGYVP